MRGYRLKCCWLFNFYMTSQEASGRLPAVRWKKYRSGIRFMVKPPLHQHQIEQVAEQFFARNSFCQVAEQFFETLQHSWRIKLNVLIWSRTLNLWRPPCCRTVLPFSDIWTSCCLSQPYIYTYIYIVQSLDSPNFAKWSSVCTQPGCSKKLCGRAQGILSLTPKSSRLPTGFHGRHSRQEFTPLWRPKDNNDSWFTSR